jgi:long-chain acyl-CoA synthetase
LIDVPDKEIRVATGGEGEVIVRGPNVFQGYWQEDELTAEAKLDGWLRTGDLARIDRDGSIYLTGRSKYVIVLDSGEKVHPDEIEQKLVSGNTIEDVCITGRNSRGKVQVTAVVYPRLEGLREQAMAAGVELSPASLERLVGDEVQRLTRDMAAFKRVSRVELTDTPLPKTVLRKVARGRLEDAYGFDFQRWLEAAEAATG